MAVSKGRKGQSTGSLAARDGNGAPDKHEADPLAQTRRLVAMVVSVTFSVIALLIVAGGLAGRFDQTLVDAVVTALASAAGAVWVYLFHRNKAGSE